MNQQELRERTYVMFNEISLNLETHRLIYLSPVTICSNGTFFVPGIQRQLRLSLCESLHVFATGIFFCYNV
jgi:hypothetical protein